MSYILDALRRLEQDKEKARKPANPLQTVLHPEPDTAIRREKGGKVWWPWALAGLLILLAAVFVTFLIARSTAPVQRAGQNSLPSTPAAYTPQARRALPAGRDRSFSIDAPPAPGREAPAPAVSPRPVPAPPAVPVISPVAVLPEPAATPAAVEPGAGSGTREGAVPRTPPVRVERRTAAPESAVEKPKALPPRLSGSETGLKISAIVWSPDRSKRFAIVNLKTVYAGDRIAGSRVVEIGEDALVFDREGDQFSVGMRGR
jgi:hypothetical protein